MDEILALQKELATVQEQDTVHRLSERNCIELVLKLMQLGLIQVVYTCNAKEFLTPKQLRLEIQDELLSAGGRVALTDIQPILNVDIFHIEKAANEIVQEDPSILLISGELIAPWHLDGLVEEVNQQLQDVGKLSVASLATQFGLPVPMTDRVVKDRLGNILRAKLKNGVLYTEAFEKTQMARIRGVCCAVTRPVSVPELVSLHDFDETVVDDAITALVKSGQLAGSVRGREYVPAAFSRSQRSCIDAFFAQNGYIEHTRASKLRVHKPLDFVRQSFPDAIAVGRGSKQIVVASAVLKGLEGSIEEAVHTKSYVDVKDILPSVLEGECASLLNESSMVGLGADQPALAMASTYAVSKAFIQGLMKRFEADASRKAEEVAAKKKSGSMGLARSDSSGVHPQQSGSDLDDSASATAAAADSAYDTPAKDRRPAPKGKGRGGGAAAADTNDDDTPQATKGGGGGGSTSNAKKGKGGRGGRKKGANDSDDDEDAVAVAPLPPSSTKKGGRRGKANAEEDDAPATTTPQPSTKGRSSTKKGARASTSTGGGGGGGGKKDEAAAAVYITPGEIESTILDCHAELADHAELLEALVEKMSGDVTQMYNAAVTAALASVHQGDAATRRQEEKQFEEDLRSAVDSLQLVSRGVGVLPLTEEDKAVIETHILKTKAAQLAAHITRRTVRLHPDMTYDNATGSTAQMPSITLEQRNAFKSGLPKPLGEAVAALWTTALRGRQSLVDFMDCLEQSLPALDVLYRKMDKKKEKAAVFARRMQLLSQLSESQSASEVLLSAQQLGLIQAKSCVLFAMPEDADMFVSSEGDEGTALLTKALGLFAEAEQVDEDLVTRITSLESCVAAYEARSGHTEEQRATEAQELMDAMQAVKDAFARKGGREGER